MAERRVTGDVYSWMTARADKPGQFHHNTAYRGDVIEVSEEEAERGESLGFLADPDAPDPEPEDAVVEDDEDLAVVVTSDGVEHVGVLPASAASDEDEDDSDAEPEPEVARPARAANKAAWIDYAIAKGADESWARDEDTTKDDLIARYGA